MYKHNKRKEGTNTTRENYVCTNTARKKKLYVQTNQGKIMHKHEERKL